MTTGTKTEDSYRTYTFNNQVLNLLTRVEKSWSGMDGRSNLVNPWDCMIEKTIYKVWSPDGGTIYPFTFNASGNAPFIGNMSINLMNDAYDQFRNSDFQGDTFIAEGKESAEMIAGRSKDFVKLVKKLFGGRWKEIMRDLSNPLKRDKIADTLSSLWLEYQYGWAPLIGDIQSGMKTFQDMGSFSPEVLVKPKFYAKDVKVYNDSAIKGRIITTHSVQRVLTGSGTPSNYLPDHFGFSPFPFELYEIFNSDDVFRKKQIAFASALSRFDTTRYSDTGWNLLPLSFVFDWFVPIGDYFTALEGLKNVEWKSGWETIKTARKCIVDDLVGHENGFMETGLTHHAITFSRRPLNDLTVAPPVFKPLSKALSPTHIANAVALAIGFRKVFR